MGFYEHYGCSICRELPTVPCSTLCEKHYRERWNKLSPIALRGAQTRRERYPERHVPISADQFWQRYALQMVAVAKERGILPKLDGSIACSDCGGVATKYEHRDYSRPLEVEPVCASCNSRRGTAKWPAPQVFKKVSEEAA